MRKKIAKQPAMHRVCPVRRRIKSVVKVVLCLSVFLALRVRPPVGSLRYSLLASSRLEDGGRNRKGQFPAPGPSIGVLGGRGGEQISTPGPRALAPSRPFLWCANGLAVGFQGSTRGEPRAHQTAAAPAPLPRSCSERACFHCPHGRRGSHSELALGPDARRLSVVSDLALAG